MTVETKPEEEGTPMDAGAAEQNVVTVVSGVEEDHHPKLKEEEEKKDGKKDGEEEAVAVVQNEKSASFREESNFLSDLKEQERKALLRYIPAEEIPLHYGGLRRENDTEFVAKDGGVSEVTVKAGSTENIELPAPLVGTTLLWDLTVLGWEVNYKEEFVPDDQGSYTVIVHKGRKMGSQEQPIRNSFRNNEPGKVVLTVENNTYKKKKLLYRYKAKTP